MTCRLPWAQPGAQQHGVQRRENAGRQHRMRKPQALDRRAEQPEQRQPEPERLRPVIELRPDRHAVAEQVIARQHPCDDRRMVRIEDLDGEVVRIHLVHVHTGKFDVP